LATWAEQLLDEADPDGIEVHVIQFLCKLPARIKFEGIMLRCPQRVSRIRNPEVVGFLLSIPSPNGVTRQPFPAVHESAQLPGLWRPDNGMHMIWHDDKTNMPGIVTPKLIIQLTQQDSFWLNFIEQSRAGITGDGHEVAIQLFLNDPARIGHRPIVPGSSSIGNLLRRRRPGCQASGATGVRIAAHVFDFNAASARVLEKNGFELEGLLKKGRQKDGKFLDVKLFALTK